jgi:hypothetical protein
VVLCSDPSIDVWAGLAWKMGLLQDPLPAHCPPERQSGPGTGRGLSVQARSKGQRLCQGLIFPLSPGGPCKGASR